MRMLAKCMVYGRNPSYPLIVTLRVTINSQAISIQYLHMCCYSLLLVSITLYANSVMFVICKT